MATERGDKTAIDYVLIILTPAMIMTLVTSLVFFLIEVIYPGEYKDRLRLGFFCYVVGAVLVARISMMDEIASRAIGYGVVLAILGWLLLQVYIRYDSDSAFALFGWLINMVLIAIVWWSTHRLTWDCTNVDADSDDAGGEGLLEAAGLEPKSIRIEDRKARAEEARDPPGFSGWWARYQRFREKRMKNRPLGVWVVYFALASLPLFGLGQALLRSEDTEQRRTVFWLMAIYVASGLALLLTTCFLTLRRYLRQRNVEMPAKMTAAWLGTGAGIILVLLILGALLPRPSPEYSLLDFNPLRSEKRDANQFAPTKDKGGKNEGAKDGSSQNQKDTSEGKDSGQKDGKNSGNAKDSGQKDSKNNEKAQDSGQKDSKNNEKAQDKSESSGDKGNKDKGGQTASKQRQDGSKDKDSKESKGAKDSKDSKDGSSKDQEEKGDKETSKSEKSSSSSKSNSSSSSSNNPLTAISNALGPLATVLKWVVFAVVALIVLFLAFRHGLSFLANFTQWARDLLASLQNFWAGLFGERADKEKGSQADGDEGELIEEAAPFAAFRNPFADGSATQRSPRELLRYTFAALEALGRDQELGRQPQETALEFAIRIAKEVPGLAEQLRRFIGLYIRSEYARGGLPSDSLSAVKEFWDRLEATAEQPISR